LFRLFPALIKGGSERPGAGHEGVVCEALALRAASWREDGT